MSPNLLLLLFVKLNGRVHEILTIYILNNSKKCKCEDFEIYID